jgi:hypothetical protein
LGIFGAHLANFRQVARCRIKDEKINRTAPHAPRAGASPNDAVLLLFMLKVQLHHGMLFAQMDQIIIALPTRPPPQRPRDGI